MGRHSIKLLLEIIKHLLKGGVVEYCLIIDQGIVRAC